MDSRFLCMQVHKGRCINMMKKLMMLMILLLIIPMTAGADEEYDMNDDIVAEIASYLAMDGHSEHDLANCATKYRYYNEIAEMLNEGYDKDEILAEYKSMYGEEGFRAPDRFGFSMLAWVLPFVALGAGSYAFFRRVREQVKHSVEETENEKDHDEKKSAKEEAEDDIYRSILEEEKRKHF